MTASRREVLRRLLAGVFQAGGAAVVILAAGPLRAGEETPLPEQDLTVLQPPRDVDRRVERVAAVADGAPPLTGEEDSWVNAGFRNAGFNNGGFRNVGVGGGGGFRNSGFANAPGPAGFRNSAFRNW